MVVRAPRADCVFRFGTGFGTEAVGWLRRKASVWSGVLTVCIWGLAGCSVPIQEHAYEFPELTLAEAREIQDAQLQEFIDLLPDDEVTEVWGPIPEASLLSCDTGLGGERLYWRKETGSYSLPGGGEVTLRETFDALAFFDEVADRQEELGWDADLGYTNLKDDMEWTRLGLYSPDGFNYSLTFFPQEADRPQAIRLRSYSPCFIPDREISLHREY